MSYLLLKSVFMTGVILSADSRHDVILHTDLIQTIAISGKCPDSLTQLNSTYDQTYEGSIRSITLSQFSFSQIIASKPKDEGCVRTDISNHPFILYNWTCFSDKNGSDIFHDPNWYFVACATSRIISVLCLSDDVTKEINDNLCTEGFVEHTCVSFTSALDTKRHMCSRTFRTQHVFNEIDKEKDKSITVLDIVAYLSASFIIVSFLLAICIPAQKCKPTYQYDKEMGLRVPLEIYEMYGAKYMPSAKRKLTKNMDKFKRKMSRFKSHSKNVAFIENSPEATQTVTGAVQAVKAGINELDVEDETNETGNMANNMDGAAIPAITKDSSANKIQTVENPAKTRKFSTC